VNEAVECENRIGEGKGRREDRGIPQLRKADPSSSATPSGEQGGQAVSDKKKEGLGTGGLPADWEGAQKNGGGCACGRGQGKRLGGP